MILKAPVDYLTPAEQRLFNILIRPMSRQELALALGVTRQRIKCLEVRLLNKGFVRYDVDIRSIHFIARTSDLTTILNRIQVRVLSVIDRKNESLTYSIGALLKVEDNELRLALSVLKREGLIIDKHHFSGRVMWILTNKGHNHPQRREFLSKATLAPTGVRSERSINVLSLLASEGPTRGRDISERLGLDRVSLNAFMQYLKGKGWIKKTGSKMMDPYELTATGTLVVDGLRSRGHEA